MQPGAVGLSRRPAPRGDESGCAAARYRRELVLPIRIAAGGFVRDEGDRWSAQLDWRARREPEMNPVTPPTSRLS